MCLANSPGALRSLPSSVYAPLHLRRQEGAVQANGAPWSCAEFSQVSWPQPPLETVLLLSLALWLFLWQLLHLSGCRFSFHALGFLLPFLGLKRSCQRTPWDWTLFLTVLADFRLTRQSETLISLEKFLCAVVTSNFNRLLRATCDCGLADACTVDYEY